MRHKPASKYPMAKISCRKAPPPPCTQFAAAEKCALLNTSSERTGLPSLSDKQNIVPGPEPTMALAFAIFVQCKHSCRY